MGTDAWCIVAYNRVTASGGLEPVGVSNPEQAWEVTLSGH